MLCQGKEQRGRTSTSHYVIYLGESGNGVVDAVNLDVGIREGNRDVECTCIGDGGSVENTN
jgi:hypothetical protein